MPGLTSRQSTCNTRHAYKGMLLSWHMEALQCTCTAFACRTTDLLQRQCNQPRIHSVSESPPRYGLSALRIRRWQRSGARCRARGTGSSDNAGDEDSNARQDDSPGSSGDPSTGFVNSWDKWGFRFGVFRPSGSKSSEEERARKIKQDEWERWQRSWSEVHASLQYATME